MKCRLVHVLAVAAVGLMLFASSAFAAPIKYFDAQIEDIPVGKTIQSANTTFVNGAAVPVQTGGDGADGMWKQRPFHNADVSGNATIYESRGQFNGPNTENAPILKTTIDVPALDQGTTRSVWAFFWSDGSPWRLSASLWNQGKAPQPVENWLPEFDQYFAPAGYVYTSVLGAPVPNAEVEVSATTSNPGGGQAVDVSSGGRTMFAAYLGEETLGSTLTVYADDGQVFIPHTGSGAHNHRTWYDGIGYGDSIADMLTNYGTSLPLEALPDNPEPASIILLGIGTLAGFGMIRRRRRNG